MDRATTPYEPRRPLWLGFSPCPNDCFVFDALVHGRVATPLRFDAVLADVEALNGMARSATASAPWSWRGPPAST